MLPQNEFSRSTKNGSTKKVTFLMNDEKRPTFSVKDFASAPQQEVQITFATYPETPTDVWSNVNFCQLEVMLHLWQEMLLSAEIEFQRQVEETEHRAKTIILNDLRLLYLRHLTDVCRASQQQIETNVELIDIDLHDLEEIVQRLERRMGNIDVDLRKHYIFNALMNIDCSVKDFEQKLFEIKSYLSCLESQSLSSPIGAIEKLTRLNKNTINRLTYNLNNADMMAKRLTFETEKVEALQESISSVQRLINLQSNCPN